MKRRFPRLLWFGLLVVVAAPVLYLAVFIRYPATRDFPWASLAMFGLGVGFIISAVCDAFRDPAKYRGRVAAPLALTFGVLLAGYFSYVLLYQAREIPDSLGAPRVGQLAPDFTLPDQDGHPVSLAQLLAPTDETANKANGILLVFYRGYW